MFAEFYIIHGQYPFLHFSRVTMVVHYQFYDFGEQEEHGESGKHYMGDAYTTVKSILETESVILCNNFFNTKFM